MRNDIRSRYDKWHESLDASSTVAEPWYELVRQRLRPEDVAGRRILEVACGRGGFACWLAASPSAPEAVVAADYSSVAVEKGRGLARRLGVARISWENGDIGALPHPADSFDTVISCETVEHVENAQTAIRELARVLKPGGRLFLTTPNYMGPYGLYRVYLRMRGRRFTETGQPVNRFTTLPRSVYWVWRAGLRIRQVGAGGHYLFWPGRPPQRVPRLEIGLLSPFALHSIIVAEKRPRVLE